MKNQPLLILDLSKGWSDEARAAAAEARRANQGPVEGKETVHEGSDNGSFHGLEALVKEANWSNGDRSQSLSVTSAEVKYSFEGEDYSADVDLSKRKDGDWEVTKGYTSGNGSEADYFLEDIPRKGEVFSDKEMRKFIRSKHMQGRNLRDDSGGGK